MYIDPRTGAIQKQTEKQKRVLENGTTVLDLDFGFTDETVKANIEDAKVNDSKLGLVEKLPLIAGILGLISAAVGFFLWSSARRTDEGGHERSYRGGDGSGPGEARDDTLDVFGDGERDGEPTRSRLDLRKR